MPPGEALEGLLRSLGVAADDLQPTHAQRVLQYRSLLADRRVLILLDNARAADQVRDLLPGTPSSVVLVTSRDSLAGLVVRNGAHRLTLQPFGSAEAVALLAALLGERAEQDPAGAAQLADRCAGLPLALRIAAELAAVRATVPLAELAAELDRHRLDLFGVGDDPGTAIRSVFS